MSTKNCDLCGGATTEIWKIEKGVAPNVYLEEKRGTKISPQTISFCQECQIIQNFHDFTNDDLYGSYVYRTPLTSMDDDIVDFISGFIQKNRIKKVVEVAGNNGNFGFKLVNAVDDDELDYTIIDSVDLQVSDSRITHINTFLEPGSAHLFQMLNPDLVIIRHGLAHNKSLVSFFESIIDFLNPNFIYVENASLECTLKNSDFSQFYSEHFFHLTPFTVSKLGNIFGYSTTSSIDFDIHNGSFGILLSRGLDAKALESPNITAHKLIETLDRWIGDVEDFWRHVKKADK